MIYALATHDEKMISAVQAFCHERGIDRSHFEFQMLYGVRRDLQRKLVEEGFRVRVYVPCTRVVPIFHAPPGRAAGQRSLPGPELLPLKSGVRMLAPTAQPRVGFRHLPQAGYAVKQ